MQFEDIRPYSDAEYPEVIQKLLLQPAFAGAVRSYFPEIPDTQIRELFLSCNSIRDFQQRVIAAVVDKIIARSLTELHVDGLEQLDRSKPYLFMSNHRDIVLDSAFLNYALNKAGFPTSEIAIGSNLVEIGWVRDLVRINKSFIVKRGLPIQEMLEASRTLSAYIDYAIHVKRESVWIAQREGRTKDGNDRTNPGLLKMFGLGVDKNLLDHLMDLDIVPVSISYEYDPCDYLKIPELTARAKGEGYTKKPGEDVQHMLSGIQGSKGRVQLTFGRPISEELAAPAGIRNRNEQLRAVAEIIDRHIHKNYRLWPTNYIAADLLTDSDRFAAHYSVTEKEAFGQYLQERLRAFSEQALARKLFLSTYANPVFNQISGQ